MEKKLLFPETKVYRKLPANYNSDDKIYFEREFVKNINPTFLLKYNNVIVTAQGIIFSKYKLSKNSLLSETFAKEFNFKYLLSTLLRKKKLSLLDNETYVLAFNYWYYGYFHFITETLPRLYVIKEQLKNYILLLPKELDHYHISSLAPFTFKDIVFIPKNNYVKVKNLVMPTHTAGTGNYNEEIIRQLRNYYHEYYSNKKLINLGEKIFISRKKALKRRIENEDELQNILEKFGYRTVYFEDYSFEEQVGIAYNAKVLIGLHGAGLTNMLFMKPKTSVFELKFINDKHNLCYYSLASALELNYFYQICIYANHSSNLDPHKENVIVDLESFSKNLEIIWK